MASCPSVCLSVRLSVTLRYRDHIGWNSAKIITRLISLNFSLSADPNMTDLLQREHPQILAGIGVGYAKFSIFDIYADVSRKRYKIGSKLLLTTNRNMCTRFRLVPKSMTFDDLWARFKVIDPLNGAKWRNVDVSWWYRLEICENTFTAD